MRKIKLKIWPGLLALVLSGATFAHGQGGYGGYSNSGWSGNATVWGNSMGHSGFAGSLTYGVGYGYAPGYVPWAGPRHGPQCHHGYNRGYDRAYRKGYKHGRKSNRHQRGRHH